MSLEQNRVEIDVVGGFSDLSYGEKFERWAETYESIPEVTALTTMEGFRDKEVLEPGMGTGRLTFRLAEFGRPDRHTAFDIRPELVEHSERKRREGTEVLGEPLSEEAAESIEFLVGDMNVASEGLESRGDIYAPFQDNSFDIVVDAWTGHPASRRVFEEYDRVLRDGGSVLMIKYWPESEMDELVNRFLSEVEDIEAGA